MRDRETLYPILQSRVGPDQFVSRILHLREDPRFRSVGPNVLELVDEEDSLDDLSEEDGLWFDYAFVEFLKTNYSAPLAFLFCDWSAHDLASQSPSSARSSWTRTRLSQVVSASFFGTLVQPADHPVPAQAVR